MNSGSEANVFSLSFEKFMGLEELHSGILSRCRSQLDRLRSAPAEGLLARLEKAPRWDSTVVVVDSVTFESASTIESLSVNPVGLQGSERPSISKDIGDGASPRRDCRGNCLEN